MKKAIKTLILAIFVAAMLFATAAAEDAAVEILYEMPEDPFDTGMSLLEEKHADIYAGIYYSQSDKKYHILSLDPAAIKKTLAEDERIRSYFVGITSGFAFEEAEFTIKELETAQNIITDELIKALGLYDSFLVGVAQKENTVFAEANFDKFKDLRSRVKNAVNIKSKKSGVSLSDRLDLVSVEQAIVFTTGYEPPPLPKLTRENMMEFLALDKENEAYSRVRFYPYEHPGSENYDNGLGEFFEGYEALSDEIIAIFDKLNTAEATGMTTSVYEGDAVVFLTDGTRYSYTFEKDDILNINGVCYKIDRQTADEFKKACANFKDKYPMFRSAPKWLAFMNPKNITSITCSTAKSGSVKINAGAMEMFAEMFFRNLQVNSGERYEIGSITPYTGTDGFKSTIKFNSGVTYTITAVGKTLCVESSGMGYGCKYEMLHDTADLLNYYFDEWSWAKTSQDFNIPTT